MQTESTTKPPPNTFFGILSYLGPGLIIAASIVGSGELIATTLTGARGGLILLWLIILGCVVKVFAQIEIGRYTVSTGVPTLSALNTVPGPRVANRGNWLIWYWFFMWFCSIGQLGGIVGSVGQIMALVQPVTAQGAAYHEIGDLETKLRLASVATHPGVVQGQTAQEIEVKLKELQDAYLQKYAQGSAAVSALPRPMDDRYWAIPVAFITA
jgi:hypothetical protein